MFNWGVDAIMLYVIFESPCCFGCGPDQFVEEDEVFGRVPEVVDGSVHRLVSNEADDRVYLCWMDVYLGED